MLTILPVGTGTKIVCAADMDHVISSDVPQVRMAFIDLSPSENVELEPGHSERIASLRKLGAILIHNRRVKVKSGFAPLRVDRRGTPRIARFPPWCRL